jgi:hypothetical protein
LKNALVCQNSTCRILVDLGKDRRGVNLSAIGLKRCPECGGDWGTNCPFCDAPLEVIVRTNKSPVCSSCHRGIRPEVLDPNQASL